MADTGTCDAELFATRGLDLERADAWCDSNCRDSPPWLLNAENVTHEDGSVTLEEVVAYSVGDRVEIDGNSACVVNVFHHTVGGLTTPNPNPNPNANPNPNPNPNLRQRASRRPAAQWCHAAPG